MDATVDLQFAGLDNLPPACGREGSIYAAYLPQIWRLNAQDLAHKTYCPKYLIKYDTIRCWAELSKSGHGWSAEMAIQRVALGESPYWLHLDARDCLHDPITQSVFIHTVYWVYIPVFTNIIITDGWHEPMLPETKTPCANPRVWAD